MAKFVVMVTAPEHPDEPVTDPEYWGPFDSMDEVVAWIDKNAKPPLTSRAVEMFEP